MARVRKVQKRRLCIFCQKAGSSREHVFPDWMRHYLEDTPGISILRRPEGRDQSTGKVAKLGPYRPGKFYRPAPARSRKLYVVCKTCNETWMSGLQNAAKPLLIPFITGEWPALNSEQQKTIAAWATMFTMVLDVSDLQVSGISQAERAHLMNTLTPPPHWLIWMHAFEKPKTAYFWHHGYGVAVPLEELKKIPAETPPPCNTQTTFFICGHAIFHTFSTDASLSGTPLHTFLNPALIDATRSRLDHRQLWPLTGRWDPQAPEPFRQQFIQRIVEVITGVIWAFFPD